MGRPEAVAFLLTTADLRMAGPLGTSHRPSASFASRPLRPHAPPDGDGWGVVRKGVCFCAENVYSSTKKPLPGIGGWKVGHIKL